MDVSRARLLLSVVDAKNKWHTIANLITNGSSKVAYIDLGRIEQFEGPDGFYLVFDTKGSSIPILGIEQLVTN